MQVNSTCSSQLPPEQRLVVVARWQLEKDAPYLVREDLVCDLYHIFQLYVYYSLVEIIDSGFVLVFDNDIYSCESEKTVTVCVCQ